MGWIVPGELQLRQYTGRFAGVDGRLLTLSDSSKTWATLPDSIDGIPVQHEPWDTLRTAIRRARPHADARERLWLKELETYMGQATSHRPLDDQWVYCVVVSDTLFGGVSFRDYVQHQRRYFHP